MAYQAEQAEKYSLRVQVYYKLRDNILNGIYEEGMLLQEIKISEEFGVSRTPVREALKQLELEGLILMIPNKG
ncbi:MAG: GntR family transcriptional regulator, partial [Clostridiales bacterium]|nr:GntR family transcriptional regulator [Clostridiales bacterium]